MRHILHSLTFWDKNHTSVASGVLFFLWRVAHFGIKVNECSCNFSQWSHAEIEINFRRAFACVSRWPGDLADADLPPHSASPPGGLRSSDVPAALRNQHGHVSETLHPNITSVVQYRSELFYRLGRDDRLFITV